MESKLLKLGLGTIFLISLASLGAILLFIDPYRAGGVMLALFSLSVLMLGFSFFAWLGLWLRRKFVSQKNLNRVLKMVFREGALATLVALSYLWLAHFKLFKIWPAILVLLAVVGTEYYFLVFHGRAGESSE